VCVCVRRTSKSLDGVGERESERVCVCVREREKERESVCEAHQQEP